MLLSAGPIEVNPKNPGFMDLLTFWVKKVGNLILPPIMSDQNLVRFSAFFANIIGLI